MSVLLIFTLISVNLQSILPLVNLLFQLETGNSVKLLPSPFRVMLPPRPDRPSRKS